MTCLFQMYCDKFPFREPLYYDGNTERCVPTCDLQLHPCLCLEMSRRMFCSRFFLQCSCVCVSVFSWSHCICIRVLACAQRLTCEVCACTVGSQVAAVSVGCVTLKQTLVISLHFGDVEHGRVTAHPLHIDLFAVHPLSVNSVGVVRLSRANDADLPVGCRWQIHGPLKVLHGPLFVAGHVAPDGHMRTLRPDQRSTLHRHHPLSHGDTGYTEEEMANRERGRKDGKTRKTREQGLQNCSFKYFMFSIFMHRVSLRKYRNTVTCAAEHSRKYLLKFRDTHTHFEHDQRLETFTAAF